MDPNKPEAPHDGHNNLHGSPTTPSSGVAHNVPNRSVGPLRNAMATIWNAVQRILKIYIVFAVLTNAITEFFPEIGCILPVISRHSPRCVRELDYPDKPAINPDFIGLSRLQLRLGKVMEDSAISPVAADDIKGLEIDMRDLVKRVEISSLVRKDTLGRDLERFVADAQIAGGSLQEFSSHVWGAVDQVLSLNEYTLIMLESMSRETLWRFASGIANVLKPIGHGTTATPQKSTEDIWYRATESLDINLRRLVHEAQANVGFLHRLEVDLNNIQDIIIVEEEILRSEERVLKRQWRPDDANWRSNSIVLEMVQSRRNHALKYVTGVLAQLRILSNDLDDLKERAKVPLIDGSSNIPIEAYIGHIRNATERLVRGQTRAQEIEDEYRRRKFCSNLPT